MTDATEEEPRFKPFDMTVEDAVKRLNGNDYEAIARAFNTSSFEKLDSLVPWAIVYAHLHKQNPDIKKRDVMDLSTEEVTALFRTTEQ